ncbi:MAG: citrulline utilization hydrolase CtlX [Bacteroidota bacterium]
MQTTSHLLMIRPVRFGFNAQTAVNNAFQIADANQQEVEKKAIAEFDDFVEKLRNAHVDVTVVEDTPEPHTPDSLFPNNWISFHSNGTIVLYPMFAENRRLERKPTVLAAIKNKFLIQQTEDMSVYENKQLYLEGTGSMVLDRDNRFAYACLSPRTDRQVLEDFCTRMNYTPVVFNSMDEKNQPIYHTNVMMCVADRYVVICLDSIPDEREKNSVIEKIKASGKSIISISLSQMNHFAGNMLQIENSSGEKILVLSSQAYESLTPAQVAELSGFNRILHSSLHTIESNGGGSARCMMAEIHLPLLQ